MDGVGQSTLQLLRDSLLDCLGDNAVTSGVTLGARGAGIVEGVGDVLLDALGELVLSSLRDLGAAGGVRNTLTVFVLHGDVG